MPAKPTIGFLGLGHMGQGMAANMLGKGFPLVTMAHRRREVLDELVSKGAVAAMARSAEVTLLCLTKLAGLNITIAKEPAHA